MLSFLDQPTLLSEAKGDRGRSKTSVEQRRLVGAGVLVQNGALCLVNNSVQSLVLGMMFKALPEVTVNTELG